MSLSLKHIPCPAGSNCTAFHCIFGHENEKPSAPSVPSTVSRTVNNAYGTQDGTSENQHVPRKRMRTDPAQPAASTESSVEAIKTAARVPSSHTSSRVVPDLKSSSTHPETTTRPISPPPLKRKTPSPEKRQQPTPNVPPQNTKHVAANSRSMSSSVTKSKLVTSKKPETLNPRLLKSSPASHEIRLKLIKMLHQEFSRLNKDLKKESKGDEKRLVLSDQELIIKTLDEEQYTAIHKAAVYSNLMKNKVMQYKRMNVSKWKAEREEEWKKEHKDEMEQDASSEPTKIITGLTTAQEVELTKRLITPIHNLTEHGYVPVPPSDEDIEKARQGVEMSKGWEKCDRCQQRFQVFPGRREEDGALTSGGTCTFHWGKTYIAPKAPGDRTRQPKRYQCCGQEVGDSVGCFTRDHHVFKTSDPKRLASTLQFAHTPENALAPTNRAVCFDCEMGYTVYGMELIRLTATSWPTGEVLLDVLVRPLGEILDLNSRYSGVWPEDLAQAEPWSAEPQPDKDRSELGSEDGELRPKKKKLKIVSSPEVARDLLFSLLSPTTPLIGHGLENDLNAVRIVHPTLIDTILLYPHKAGLPYRYGLKMLMDIHLNRKIQQETGPKMLGHDSAEDARAAGDLVRLKIRNEWMDMQRAGWKLVDGNFVAPGQVYGEKGLTEEFLES